mmetsp:Transcript_31797/g.66377  ORF Transcript_31797/g.66377 Transcript_31797/m.66377 type:complete len:92 (-) Transcript_31797:224-499(-)
MDSVKMVCGFGEFTMGGGLLGYVAALFGFCFFHNVRVIMELLQHVAKRIMSSIGKWDRFGFNPRFIVSLSRHWVSESDQLSLRMQVGHSTS